MTINNKSKSIEDAFLLSDEEAVEQGLYDSDDMFRNPTEEEMARARALDRILEGKPYRVSKLVDDRHYRGEEVDAEHRINVMGY